MFIFNLGNSTALNCRVLIKTAHMLLLQFHPLCILYIFIFSYFFNIIGYSGSGLIKWLLASRCHRPLWAAWQLHFWLKTARKGASIWLYVNQLADSKFISPVQQNWSRSWSWATDRRCWTIKSAQAAKWATDAGEEIREEEGVGEGSSFHVSAHKSAA